MPLSARGSSVPGRRSSAGESGMPRRIAPCPPDILGSGPPAPTGAENAASVERVYIDGVQAAIIVRATHTADATQFLTPPDWSLQTGFIVYPAGGQVAAHRHKPLIRCIQDTGEVLIVRHGRCAVDFYDTRHQRVDTRELSAGDVLMLCSGGHGLRMFEDTVLLEIKQGPYAGPDEKEFL